MFINCDGNFSLAVVIYDDHSLFIWDVQDVDKVFL